MSTNVLHVHVTVHNSCEIFLGVYFTGHLILNLSSFTHIKTKISECGKYPGQLFLCLLCRGEIILVTEYELFFYTIYVQCKHKELHRSNEIIYVYHI